MVGGGYKQGKSSNNFRAVSGFVLHALSYCTPHNSCHVAINALSVVTSIHCLKVERSAWALRLHRFRSSTEPEMPVQRSAKKHINLAKQDPGRARQSM